jgi:hypothetical protein
MKAGTSHMAGYMALYLASSGCNSVDFDLANQLTAVRVLAVRADKPYAAPGDTVTLNVLAYDGRPEKATPMRVFFFPVLCENPPSDAYYACYRYASALEPFVDLTPGLLEATAFSFVMPPDIIARHGVTPGRDAYGTAIVSLSACAGHIEVAPPPATASPQTVPFRCVDAAGQAVGPEGFVFSFARVYAFTSRTNENPRIDQVLFAGQALPWTGDMTKTMPIEIDHCTAAQVDDCPPTPIDVAVPETSQEPDPSNVDPDGRVGGEQLWVDYYVTAGKVANDVTILYDARVGKLGKTENEFRAPLLPGRETLWAVVHDNRGGVTWVEVPMNVH